jgi:hypothetical protein
VGAAWSTKVQQVAPHEGKRRLLPPTQEEPLGMEDRLSPGRSPERPALQRGRRLQFLESPRGKGSRNVGATMIGGLMRYLFSSVKALSAFGVHSNFPVRFMSLKKGRAFSPLLAMKRTRAAMDPARRCISLRLRGGHIYLMALTLSGFASIPR